MFKKAVSIQLRIKSKDLPEPPIGWPALLTKVIENDILPETRHALSLFGFDVVSEHVKVKDEVQK